MQRARIWLRRWVVRFRGNRVVRALVPTRVRSWLAAKLGPAISRDAAAQWVTAHALARGSALGDEAPGLLSFVTPVWNTPVSYLRELAASVLCQAEGLSFEWVVLDNGSTDPELIEFLDRDLAPHQNVSFFRSPQNLGIIGGTRFCLENAANRYVLPLDHDDRLYPDAAVVMARAIREHGYPAALYSDEDKLVDGRPALPFLKSGWDPVLFANQCYTAHLCAVDRRLALALDAYSDEQTEGSPDWDCFMRFVIAGHEPVHVPEVIYSWRMHEYSTAQNIDAKSYIRSSQRAVLSRFLEARPDRERFTLELSPLFDGTPDFHLRRLRRDPLPLLVVGVKSAQASGLTARTSESNYACECRDVALEVGVSELVSVVGAWASHEELVCLLAPGVEALEVDWAWEALGLLELNPDAVMVGGRIVDENDRLLDAGQVLGFGQGCDSPDKGRGVLDPGYGVWLWKQHSVSAVSSAFCVFRADYLSNLLARVPAGASLPYLGAWAGAHALRTGRRIIYSPFLLARSPLPGLWTVSEQERALFLEQNMDLLPDARYYSKYFGLDLADNYAAVGEEPRERHIRGLRECLAVPGGSLAATGR